MSRSILVIEDEREIADLIKLHLTDLSAEICLAFDGREGLEKARSGAWDLIILDLLLPDLDGLEICRRLRKSSTYTPILMLTSKSEELDRVLGLETGADDYLTKPFSVLELMARVRAILRRVQALQTGQPAPTGEQVINVADLSIDLDQRRVSVADREIRLTAKEFDLLTHFARNPGRVFTRTQLLDRVWGYGHEGYEHTVNSHINRLRAKIEPSSSTPRYIHTVWGVGYRFACNQPGH